MKRVYETRGAGPKRRIHKPSPQHSECPEGNAFLTISAKWHKIKVLLDSGSNIVLLNQNTASTLNVPYEITEKPLKISTINGEVFSTGGKYYSHPIQLEIATTGHTTLVSSEIVDSAKYDRITPFGWWHHEHPIKDIENSEK